MKLHSHKMLLTTLTLCLLFITSIYCQQSNKDALEYKNEINENGYSFRYQTSHSERQEDGTIQTINGQKGVVIVHGSYSFIGTDGNKYYVDFVADEKGYRPNVRVESVPRPEEEPVPEEGVSMKFVPFVNEAVLNSLAGGGLGK